jgi:hypothetical protein
VFYSISKLTGVDGHLPLELGQATKLTEIIIEHSDLSTGPVPDSIGLCAKLVKIRLWDCNLQGEFPVGLQKLKSLGMSIND